MPRWSEADIPWDQFDPALVDRDLLRLVKAAALTEFNAGRYAEYLGNVFEGDEAYKAEILRWRDEEVQHGELLGRYAALADPGYDFDAAFRRFTAGYQIPVEVDGSVRGSRTGELVARCVVETGTSSFYTAMGEATADPVLRALCAHIAADEFRHYRLFLDGARRYNRSEDVSRPRLLLVALGRLDETDDDELAYAWHAANDPAGAPYDHAACNRAYVKEAYKLYKRDHVDRGIGMVMKAVGLKPRGWFGRFAAWAVYRFIRHRAEAWA